MMVGLYKHIRGACDVRSHEGVVAVGNNMRPGQLLVRAPISCM